MADRDEPSRARRRWPRAMAIAPGVVIVAAVAAGLFWKERFPYGHSHACSKGLGLALRLYADDHGGWFPRGGPTPVPIRWSDEANLGQNISPQ